MPKPTITLEGVLREIMRRVLDEGWKVFCLYRDFGGHDAEGDNLERASNVPCMMDYGPRGHPNLP